MLSRLLACLVLLAVPAPAFSQIDDWTTDEWDYEGGGSDSGYDPADAVTVRRQLADLGRYLETGLAALESDNWTTAQYNCAMADDVVDRTDYSGEAAFVDGRTMARKCIADAAFGKENTEIACEWWATVDYDSFIWEDPYSICTEE